MARRKTGGVWHVKNLDPVVNKLRAEVRRNPARVTRRLPQFVAEVGLTHHPCDDSEAYITRLLFVPGEDWFVLHLSDGWYVRYQVLPSCRATSGEVVFAEPDRIAHRARR